MDQIAGEHRRVAALAGADREMVGRVARGRGQSDMVVERMVAGDQLGPVGLDDRQHAVGDLVERRLLMDLAPVGRIPFSRTGSAPSERSGPSGRSPAACSSRHDRRADGVHITKSMSSTPSPAAFSAPIQLPSVFLFQVGRMREVLVVADAAVDQDVVVRRLDDIGLEAQHDIAGRRGRSRRAPARSRFSLEGFLRQVSAGIRASA